jgi:transcriptional regulator with XRE-family HTH domain
MASPTNDDPARDFGVMLRKARLRAGLSQTRVAESMGSTQAYVSRAERGLENPPLLTCCAFAAAVGCRFTFSIS